MLPFFEKKDEELFVYNFKNFSFPAHFHPALEVIVVERGSVTAVINGERYILHEGETALTFPGIIHYYETASGDENEGYVMLIGKSLMGEYKNDSENYLPKRCVFETEELDKDCVRAADVLRCAAGKPRRMQRAYAGLFLYHIFDACELTETEKEDELLYKTVRFMEEHFTERVNLTETANALHVSKYTLSRLFSRFFNMGFNDYLNSLRTHRVMSLIENGARTVSEAAYESGFENVRTFNRAFKKICKMTPTEFRNERKRKCNTQK